MARLKEYNGYYCESEYEYAFIGFLETEGWIYSSGNNISRVTKRDVLIADDFKKFIVDTNPDLTEDEVTQIFDNVRLVGSESDFATLHKVYGWMVNGIQFTPQDGIARMIPLIDFKKDSNKNIFRVVNQFTVEYTNNGQKENRRPDVLLFVNGMPLCVIELKNPADANATIYDAWEQINIRYWRDIPHLLHYCTLACISDGVKTRLGTVRTPYEHFYAWRRVNDGDAVSTLPFEETKTMIKGVYAPERFLEIFRDYIYFQDNIYDSDEVEIVLAKKIKDIIDTKSSFADWLNNQNVRNQLKLDIKICLVKNGYPPQYSPEVFNKVMEQVENFEEYSVTDDIGNEATNSAKIYQYKAEYNVLKVAEDSANYGKNK